MQKQQNNKIEQEEAYIMSVIQMLKNEDMVKMEFEVCI